MMKRVIVGVLFLCLALAGMASAEENIFFGGGLSAQFNNNYSAGDNISSSVFVYNTESFPIINASLIIELVSGCINPVYPSQDSDCDNVIDELVISNINIPAGKDVEIPFNYKLPSDLASGGYRFDMFLMTKRTPIVGMQHILFSGNYYYFDLIGSGAFPTAKIIRTKTNVDGFLGPIGSSVEGGATSNLQLFISSNASFFR